MKIIWPEAGSVRWKVGDRGVGCSPEHAWPNTSNAPLPTIYTTYTHTADHSKLITATTHQNIYTIYSVYYTHTHTHTRTIFILQGACIHANLWCRKSWLIFKCKTCIIVDKIYEKLFNWSFRRRSMWRVKVRHLSVTKTSIAIGLSQCHRQRQARRIKTLGWPLHNYSGCICLTFLHYCALSNM